MKNRITVTSTLLGILMIVGNSQVLAESFRDYAKVTHVDPIYEIVRTVHPEERCREDYRPVYKRSRHLDEATLVGAIIGGVVGNQFGKGHGRDAATVAGALLGGALAQDASWDRHHVVERHHAVRCKTVDHYKERREISGYDVTYRYHGQELYTRTLRHPGKRIAVQVRVTPKKGRHHWR